MSLPKSVGTRRHPEILFPLSGGATDSADLPFQLQAQPDPNAQKTRVGNRRLPTLELIYPIRLRLQTQR